MKSVKYNWQGPNITGNVDPHDLYRAVDQQHWVKSWNLEGNWIVKSIDYSQTLSDHLEDKAQGCLGDVQITLHDICTGTDLTLRVSLQIAKLLEQSIGTGKQAGA